MTVYFGILIIFALIFDIMNLIEALKKGKGKKFFIVSNLVWYIFFGFLLVISKFPNFWLFEDPWLWLVIISTMIYSTLHIWIETIKYNCVDERELFTTRK